MTDNKEAECACANYASQLQIITQVLSNVKQALPVLPSYI